MKDFPISWKSGLAIPAVALLLVCGCSHTPGYDVTAGMPGNVFAPQAPPFLRGSMGILLTNTSGFSARVELSPAPIAEHPEEVCGRLISFEGKLLFAPDAPKKKSKKHIDPGLFFIWDVAQCGGFVVSEALQGYAPVSSSLRFTNLLIEPGPGLPARIQGCRCRPETAVIGTSEGKTSSYNLWRAADASGVAVQIVSTNRLVTETVSLSNIRLGATARETFRPPESFTRYGSVEQMMTELAIREQSIKGNPVGGWRDRGSLEDDPMRGPQH
jgi:hypothetical protein